MPSPVVIAIDGPAGAGKSTVTRAVAAILGILRLDTGAMYRAATLGLLRSGVDRDDPAAIAAWIRDREIGFDADGRVTLDGARLGDEIRTPEITREVWRIADNPACREHLVALQKAIIGDRGTVVEGRDATTVICPDATLKVFLDASPEERARRRLDEWKGASEDLAKIADEIRERDRRDRERAVGPLVCSDDAVRIDTDGRDVASVVAEIVTHAVQRRPLLLEAQVGDQLVVGRSREPGYVAVAEGGAGGTGPWQLGLTNPSPDRLPGAIAEFARNRGGRQAGVLCQGRAVIVLAGRGEEPGEVVALPMLPQTWYVLEPGAWHAVAQMPGTICAWAETAAIVEERWALSDLQDRVVRTFLRTYLGREALQEP